MQNFPPKARGFTLIELLVVIAIIGLLASIITVSLVSSRAKGRDAKRISDIKTLQLALETYYNDNSAYPLTIQSLTPNYLPTLPSDPNSSVACVAGNEAGCYVYNSFSGNNSANCGTTVIVRYHLGAAMESTELTSVQTFLQDADWNIAAPYAQCTGGGGKTSSFAGKSVGCISTTAAPDSCYDVTN